MTLFGLHSLQNWVVSEQVIKSLPAYTPHNPQPWERKTFFHISWCIVFSSLLSHAKITRGRRFKEAGRSDPGHEAPAPFYLPLVFPSTCTWVTQATSSRWEGNLPPTCMEISGPAEPILVPQPNQKPCSAPPPPLPSLISPNVPLSQLAAGQVTLSYLPNSTSNIKCPLLLD